MIEQVEIGPLHIEDYQQLLDAMKASYPNWQGGFWTISALERLIAKFPEGQIVIKIDGVVVGCALSIFVDFK